MRATPGPTQVVKDSCDDDDGHLHGLAKTRRRTRRRRQGKILKETEGKQKPWNTGVSEEIGLKRLKGARVVIADSDETGRAITACKESSEGEQALQK